ncbi:GNAT family N-acetyltransferase [Patescibacteria group bacterium]|nr:GNAT family N-acetyltransferase [Patescibacteria group bacterium]
MKSFTIRRYQTSDNARVRKLYKLASVHSEIGYRTGPWEQDFSDIPGIYLNGGNFLIGVIDDEVIAMGGLRKVSESIGHIRRMRVHPDHRRKGYAGRILSGLEETARKHGMTELQLRTSKQQIMAQRFYEKHGFIRLAGKREFYREGPFEVIWYEKTL